MHWKKASYMCHRWLALVISLQLLAWSVGGFVFSILHIDNVRGDWDRRRTSPQGVGADSVRITPPQALASAAAAGIDASRITTLTLRRRLQRPVYDLFEDGDRPVATVDAGNGLLRTRLAEEEIRTLALADFEPQAAVAGIRLLERDPPLEYRGKPLPAYQVVLDHPKNPHLYLCPVTGEVITRRNQPWRIFDFFWMLHIMDYRQRDNFNHWLLTGSSGLAILTSLSGLLLWSFRLPKGKRR